MTLSELFEKFETSAFRLEGLPAYTVPEERDAFHYYQEHKSAPVGFNSDWTAFVEDKISAGKIIQRLRLLSGNLTQYEQFELAAYSAKEDIRLALRDNHPYKGDFWLFDNKWLACLQYDSDGNYLDVSISAAIEHRADIDYWLATYASAQPRYVQSHRRDNDMHSN
jgi:hypothetical protein